jgi:hypothetical protein
MSEWAIGETVRSERNAQLMTWGRIYRRSGAMICGVPVDGEGHGASGLDHSHDDLQQLRFALAEYARRRHPPAHDFVRPEKRWRGLFRDDHGWGRFRLCGRDRLALVRRLPPGRGSLRFRHCVAALCHAGPTFCNGGRSSCHPRAQQRRAGKGAERRARRQMRNGGHASLCPPYGPTALDLASPAEPHLPDRPVKTAWTSVQHQPGRQAAIPHTRTPG